MTPAVAATPLADILVDSYRRLADVFHDILAEQSLDRLLERIADTLAELVPHDTLTIYEADEAQRLLRPVFARDQWEDEIMQSSSSFGEGLTGWAVEHREPVLAQQAHLDPRVKFVPGTPADEPEALISVPLIARGSIKGALNIYRLGDNARFSDVDFELAKRFGDAAALALDNAHVRAQLEHQAQTDSLTGVFNHRHYHERLRTELERASRAGEPVSVLMLDLDDFKRVNDIHGHAVGDDVLRMVADALAAVVRKGDTVCRVGGEEFAVILSPGEPEAALSMAERITALLPTLDLGFPGDLTVSIGVAQGPEHAMNARELTACAEAAMMTAKARGKNQIVRFEEGPAERPDGDDGRDLRSMAHMKMLQSLGGKLNRLNDVREIAAVVADELRSLIDYHNCRVFVVDGEDVVPIAFRGHLSADVTPTADVLRVRVGEGITGHVAATGKTLIVGDAAHSELGVPVPGTEEIQESILAAPICYGSRVRGVIVMSKLGLDQFDEDDARLLEVLSGHAGIALENAHLYESERREAEAARSLLHFSRELAEARGLDETLQRVVELSTGILESHGSSVWLQDADTLELASIAQHGYEPDHAERIRTSRFPAEAVERFLAGPDPFAVPAADLASVGVETSDGTFLIAPFDVDGVRGCLSVYYGPAYDPGERELRLLDGLAHQTQLAMANAGSFTNLEETFLGMLGAVAEALEGRGDPSPRARAIADLACRTGAELGMEGRSLKRLQLAALVHDIGTVAVPDPVLAKAGRLTAAERRLLRRHAELGERIVAPIQGLEDVAHVVRHVHERWDGRGYPDRLRGEVIPLESRIIAAVDAYHALTAKRPYRDALDPGRAAARLRAGAGVQLDPDVVDALLRVLDASG